MGAVRKRAVPAKPESRAEGAAWPKTLELGKRTKGERLALARLALALQYAQAPSPRVKKAQEAYKHFLNLEGEHEKQRATSRFANYIRQMLADRRDMEIIRLWPEACKLHPKRRDWRYDWLAKQLEQLKLPAGREYLEKALIPALRSKLDPKY